MRDGDEMKTVLAYGDFGSKMICEVSRGNSFSVKVPEYTRMGWLEFSDQKVVTGIVIYMFEHEGGQST